MKRLIILGAAAALSVIGIASLGEVAPVKAAACTIEVHLSVDLNGTGQGQDLCIPEGLGLPAPPV